MNKDHFPINLKKHKIQQEVPTPDAVEKLEEPRMFMLIYKGIFYCLCVLLDIRYNTSHLKSGKKKFQKPSNPVIKDSDLKNIKVDK